MKKISNHLNDVQLMPLLAGDKVREGGIDFDVVYPFKAGLGKNEDSLSVSK